MRSHGNGPDSSNCALRVFDELPKQAVGERTWGTAFGLLLDVVQQLVKPSLGAG